MGNKNLDDVKEKMDGYTIEFNVLPQPKIKSKSGRVARKLVIWLYTQVYKIKVES